MCAMAPRRTGPTLRVEKELWAGGHDVVVGLDEVGRGAWAGPLTIGAAVMPWGVGIIADRASVDLPWLGGLLGPGLSPDQLGLRAGLLVATVAPLVMAVTLIAFRRTRPESDTGETAVSAQA